VWDFAVIGRGTPAPIDAPKRLVTRGPYAVARNPMYVGMLLALVGWLALYPTAALAIYAAAVALGFHVWVVFYEEPHLRRVFGAEYDDYCSRVGRWFPRLR
jgi:protein-S-isoprenylcysteine O-methyltransferase Ste14